MLNFYGTLVLAFVFSLTAYSQPDTVKPISKTNFAWKPALVGKLSDDILSEAKIVGLHAYGKASHRFSSVFVANADVTLSLETGNTQSLFTDEFRPKQNFTLSEGKIRIIPIDYFELHLGAINQNFHESPIFIHNKTFPAAIEVLQTAGANDWSIQFLAQQAIPTAQSFSSKAVGKEESPTLFTESLRFHYQNPNTFSVAARATYFNFRNLTHGIAQDSRFYGNTVTGLGPEGARFFYIFRGWEMGLKSSIYLSNAWALQLGNSSLNNAKAPRPKNRANYVYAGILYESQKFSVAPSVGWLRVETDASPAFYSSSLFAHSNRQGITGNLSLNFKEENLVINATYVKAKTIEVSAFQADRTFVELSVATNFIPIIQ